MALLSIGSRAPSLSNTDTFQVFSPHSAYAHSIASLSYGVLWVCLAILVIVAGLVTYSIIKFRERPGGPTPKLIYGNVKLEMAYTIGFVVILGTISVFSLRSMHASDPPSSRPANLEIVAHQWWWEVRYPGTSVITANEIHVPVGVEQHVALRSADVIHDFWMPELGRKMDIIPGTTNQTWFAADTPGNYFGACAEFCGREHAWMRLRVIAQSPAEFARWEREQALIAFTPSSGPSQHGAQLFQQLGCPACHSIHGTAAQGRVGPDLTHVASRTTLAAGRLENTPDNLHAWLLDPEMLKPGSNMPNLHLSREQLDALTAYLEALR